MTVEVIPGTWLEKDWHPWFAWRPVVLDRGKVAVLRWIERRYGPKNLWIRSSAPDSVRHYEYRGIA